MVATDMHLSEIMNSARLWDGETQNARLLAGPTWQQAYFRHKVGVNSTSMVKTSRRPSSMAAEHTQVWKSLNTP